MDGAERPGEPVYGRLVRDLRASIVTAARRPSERLPSELDLARRFGISRTSVRQGLALLAREGLVERVPGRGTFVARPSAVEPDAAAPRRVAVVVNHLADPLSARIVAGTATASVRLGLEIVLGCTWNDPRTEAAHLRRALARGDDGVILFPTDTRLVDEPLQELKAAGMTTVLVDRELPGLGLDVARAAHRAGAVAAVRHLLSLGHRDIAFLTTDHLTTASVAERLRGYREALAEAGVPFRWSRVWLLPQVEKPLDDLAPAGQERQALLSYLDEPDRPRAVFALNDLLAAALLTLAGQVGVRVPDDLSVAAFDGLLPLVAGRRLTTVRQPAEAIGARAAELLVERVSGRAPPTPVLSELAVELVPGETAAAARTDARTAAG